MGIADFPMPPDASLKGSIQALLRNGLEAQIVIENWREEYNHYRPHSSLGYLTPAQFAQRCRKGEVPEPEPGEAGIDILQALTL